MTLLLEILTVIVGAVVMLVVLPRPRWRRRSERQPPQAIRPVDLLRVEHAVTARHTAAEVHARLRPLLA